MKFLGFLKKHIKLWIVLIIVIAIVLYARHSIKKAQEALEAAANEPVTSTVSVMDLQKSVSVTGTLTANDLKTVTSSIGGTGIAGVKVAKVNYKEGDYVEAGAVVVEFDGDDYNRKIAELNARYQIDDARSAKTIADSQKKIADLQKEIAEDQQWLDDKKIYYDAVKNAEKEAKKYYYDQETVAKFNETAEVVRMRDGVTIDGYEAKRDAIETKQDQINQLQQDIYLATLEQNYAQTYTQVDSKDDVYESMEKTQVSAPFSGYIITMNVEEGNNYTTGSTVFTIADTSGYVVEATVNEYDVASIQQGLPAVVKFEATGDEEFKGEVTYVSLASDATLSGTNVGAAASAMASAATTGGATATYKVKIKLTDVDERLRVGMTAKASVVLDSVSGAFAAPYDCVQEKEDGSFFINEILDDGTKKEIPVKKGLESDYYVEITGEGLKDGMTVEAIVSDAPSTDVMDYITFD
ncbi:MAG: efflux RND transporter periplasmic adaptor subunit [Pseudobutyrivibrio sp.]|nr:efflux RND transporter periplasmic adaptor subunit [Pseudobutyrivibrio sp.]